MATYSNRLPMTQVSFRRSFKSDQEDNANASNCDIGELDIERESGYQVRSEDELSKVERLCLDTVGDNLLAKMLALLAGFSETKIQLETWPLFFHSKEESGIEAQQGLVTLWSNFLIVETLMATISIQPLVTGPNIAHGWKFKLYGYIWMISMISDFWGITLTALFLAILVSTPNKLTWKWACEVSWLLNIPSILVYLDTFLILFATTYTCWLLYGYQIGIVCIVVEFSFTIANVNLLFILGKAKLKVINKNMQ